MMTHRDVPRATMRCTVPRKALQRYSGRGRLGVMATFQRHCLHCGKGIETNRSNQRFCSAKCRFAVWAKENPRLKKPKALELRSTVQHSEQRIVTRKPQEACR